MSIILSPRSHKEVKRDSKRAGEWVKELSFAVVDAFVGANFNSEEERLQSEKESLLKALT